MRAVLPSAESETETPCSEFPRASEARSLGPCCSHVSPALIQMDAPSLGAPMMAVFPSPESATDPPPESLACWIQPLPDRVHTHVSMAPATIAVLPSAEKHTRKPCWAPPMAPVPTNFAPCWTKSALHAGQHMDDNAIAIVNVIGWCHLMETLPRLHRCRMHGRMCLPL